MGILFIQQHLAKVLAGWWHTPQCWGAQWLESTSVFLEQRAKFNLHVSVLAELYPECVTPGEVLFLRAIGTVLCSHAASQLHTLLHFYLEHRCALSPADALLPWANHLLEQMLIFVFQGKMHAMWSPGQTGGSAPPVHTFPISSWWLCRHLPNIPVPGALLPNKAAFHSASQC